MVSSADPNTVRPDSERALERKLDAIQRYLGETVWREYHKETVIELMLNPDGTVWCDSLDQGMYRVLDQRKTPVTISSSVREQLVSLIGDLLKEHVGHNRPSLEGQLTFLGGARFAGIREPVVASPVICIRKHSSLVITLEKYEEHGVLTPSQAQFLKMQIEARKNILVIGGTSSGKTTFANGILDYVARVDPATRLITIEDTRELKSPVANTVQLATNHEVGVTMQHLLKMTMRLRPDRICVGEVRGGEALDLIKAWNTGHSGGVGTIHANSAEAGLYRLRSCIEEAVSSNQDNLIAEAIDLLVFLQKNHQGKRVVRELVVVEKKLKEGKFDLTSVN